MLRDLGAPTSGVPINTDADRSVLKDGLAAGAPRLVSGEHVEVSTVFASTAWQPIVTARVTRRMGMRCAFDWKTKTRIEPGVRSFYYAKRLIDRVHAGKEIRTGVAQDFT